MHKIGQNLRYRQRCRLNSTKLQKTFHSHKHISPLIFPITHEIFKCSTKCSSEMFNNLPHNPRKSFSIRPQPLLIQNFTMIFRIIIQNYIPIFWINPKIGTTFLNTAGAVNQCLQPLHSFYLTYFTEKQPFVFFCLGPRYLITIFCAEVPCRRI